MPHAVTLIRFQPSIPSLNPVHRSIRTNPHRIALGTPLEWTGAFSCPPITLLTDHNSLQYLWLPLAGRWGSKLTMSLILEMVNPSPPMADPARFRRQSENAVRLDRIPNVP